MQDDATVDSRPGDGPERPVDRRGSAAPSRARGDAFRALVGLGGAGALVLALALASCRGEPEGELVVDLVADFSALVIRQPTRLIELGEPTAHPHLVRGWFEPARTMERKMLWSMGDSAEVAFFLFRIEDLELRFRCRARAGAGPSISLSVNDSFVREQPLTPQVAEYRLTIPASLLKRGENRLEIEHAPPSIRRQRRSDMRVAWESIGFGPAPAPALEPPRASVDEGTVFIPFDTRVDLFTALPPSSKLVVDKIEIRGPSEGRLHVSWHPLQQQGPRVREQYRSGSHLVTALSSESGGRGRLSLLAVADGETTPAAGVVLTRPRIRAAPAPPAAAAADQGARPGVPGPARPNVIIYMIDTLRRDHLGCYGYHRDTSPFIDRFAEDGVLFENAQAQTPWTRASVGSVLTGLWSQIHGALGDDDALPEEVITLPERLREIGYHTAAVTANGNVNRAAGFAQGFDDFIYLENVRPGQILSRATDVNETVLEWLDAETRRTPFFLWILTIDPHVPYDAPEPFHSQFSSAPRDPEFATGPRISELALQQEPVPRETIDRLIDLYDAEIAANDAGFGALVAALRQRGLYEESLIILLSDHGEEFDDHGGWMHGATLHAEMLNTPLIVKLPGGSGPIRRREVAQHVDLVATILDVVGVPLPERTQGRSLTSLLSAPGNAGWSNRAVAHVNLRGRIATSLLDGNWKVIVDHRGGVDSYPMLFQHSIDGDEQHNLASERPDLARFLATMLRSEVRRAGDGLPAAAVDPVGRQETREQLKALGYVE
ncbi:MAG: sulfatase-like hydrolase/transferase [bacterium]|nr:sulfatase-like hydrolase/transferase [bacterium]